MIKPEERFFSDGGCYFGVPECPRTEAHLNIWDWDQLRMFKLKGAFKPDEGDELQIFAPLADCLSPEVRAVDIDNDGLMTGFSKDLKEDETIYLPRFCFETVPSLPECDTIQYSKLQDLDRFQPNVDLPFYEDESGTLQMFAFKFTSWWKSGLIRRDRFNIIGDSCEVGFLDLGMDEVTLDPLLRHLTSCYHREE